MSVTHRQCAELRYENHSKVRESLRCENHCEMQKLLWELLYSHSDSSALQRLLHLTTIFISYSNSHAPQRFSHFTAVPASHSRSYTSQHSDTSRPFQYLIAILTLQRFPHLTAIFTHFTAIHSPHTSAIFTAIFTLHSDSYTHSNSHPCKASQ